MGIRCKIIKLTNRFVPRHVCSLYSANTKTVLNLNRENKRFCFFLSYHFFFLCYPTNASHSPTNACLFFAISTPRRRSWHSQARLSYGLRFYSKFFLTGTPVILLYTVRTVFRPRFRDDIYEKRPDAVLQSISFYRVNHVFSITVRSVPLKSADAAASQPNTTISLVGERSNGVQWVNNAAPSMINLVGDFHPTITKNRHVFFAHKTQVEFPYGQGNPVNKRALLYDAFWW